LAFSWSRKGDLYFGVSVVVSVNQPLETEIDEGGRFNHVSYGVDLIDRVGSIWRHYETEEGGKWDRQDARIMKHTGKRLVCAQRRGGGLLHSSVGCSKSLILFWNWTS
jgi:hypothetical protein